METKQQVIPAHHDILCGSGGQVNGHKGNQMFRQVLRRHHSGYTNATTKPQKMRITKLVLGELALAGSRFLKKDPIFDRWYLVGDKAVRDKISHCLRRMEAPEPDAGGDDATTKVPASMIHDYDELTSEASTLTTSSKSATNATNRDSSENSVKTTSSPCREKELNTSPSQADIGLEAGILRGHRDLIDRAKFPPQPTPTVRKNQPSSPLVDSYVLMLQTSLNNNMCPYPITSGFPSFETWHQAASGGSASIDVDPRLTQQAEVNAIAHPSGSLPASAHALSASKQSAYQICEVMGLSDCDVRYFPTDLGVSCVYSL